MRELRQSSERVDLGASIASVGGPAASISGEHDASRRRAALYHLDALLEAARGRSRERGHDASFLPTMMSTPEPRIAYHVDFCVSSSSFASYDEKLTWVRQFAADVRPTRARLNVP